MLHHVSVGVADVERAGRFYDAVMKTLGCRRVMEFLPYAIAYGARLPEFWVQLPHDRRPASVGNGVHTAFSAKNKNAVHAFHRAALDAGGMNDGDPGPRPDYGDSYYGAFVRDPDGNKIEAMLIVGAAAKPRRKAPKAKKKSAEKRAPARGKAGKRKTAGRKAARR